MMARDSDDDDDILDAAWADIPRDKDGFIDAPGMPEGMYDEAVKVWEKKGGNEKDPDAPKGSEAGGGESDTMGD
jgi:hypothetical protein